MKFRISRTSDFRNNDNSPPCKGCVSEVVPMLDIRIYKSVEAHDADQRSKWLDAGTNHCILPNGNICRTMGTEKVWTIEINSLEELLAITDDELIVSAGNLEIYDYYRE